MRERGARGGRGGKAEEAEAEAAAAEATRSAALGAARALGDDDAAAASAGPDAMIDEAPLPKRCWWPPRGATADASEHLAKIGRALLSSSTSSSSSSSDFEEFVASSVDEEALGRSALVSGLVAAEAAEAAASAAAAGEGEEGEEEAGGEEAGEFIAAAAPALLALAVGGDPPLAAPALGALRAAWSLGSPLIPSSSFSRAALAVPPPSAESLLSALESAGVVVALSNARPEPQATASTSSSSSALAEARLPGFRLLARTIRDGALACIRSGGKDGSSGGSSKAASAATATNSANPFGELCGVRLFAALSALRADPVVRLAEPELGDAAAAALGAFLRRPSSDGGRGAERSQVSAVARLLLAAAEGALAASSSSSPSSSLCARSALEAVRRVPSSSSTAAGAGADVVRALAAALVASALADARRGGGAGAGAGGRSAVAAEELVLALEPCFSSSSSSSGALLSVAEAAPAAVVAIAGKLLEGEWFALGGTALVRGRSASGNGGDGAAANVHQVRAPRTARLLLEAADEALWPAVEAEAAATATRVADEEAAAAAASAAAASNGELSPSPPPPPLGPAAPTTTSQPPRPRSALAARWLPFVRAVDREAARGRGEPDRLLQLAAASMAQRYAAAASAVRNSVGSRGGIAAYGRAGDAGGLGLPI